MLSYQYLMDDFLKHKKSLNSQQLEAVESIEGPVMVLAGPGTGKTQVVAMRIGEILNRTQVLPRNILVLTFTEAGVIALRQRLEMIIGADAYQVTIATFHGFCNEIISTFPYLFDLDEAADQLSDLDRYLILEELVLGMDELVLLRPLKTPMAHIQAIANAIRTAKQENVSPDQLEVLSKDELSDSQKFTNKTEREQAAARAKKNIELAKIYKRYESELERRKGYDYEDMILKVVRELKSNEELRLHYQERYQYISVDEYQDTNNSQNALVETLAEFFINPNLLVVGDDKQAIYRFQGASVANMLHFAKKYPDIKFITLKENYRSTPEILKAAEALIENNHHQLRVFLPDFDPTLISVKASGVKPSIHELPTINSQYEFIMETIKKLVKEGAKLNEIAVLFRLNAQVREFRALAEKHGLTVGGVLHSNLMNEPEVQLLVTMLRSINNPLAERFLVPALRSLVNGPDLAELLDFISAEDRSKFSLIRRLVKSDNQSLRTAGETILELHQLSDKMSLNELFEKVVEASSLLESIRRQPDRIEGLELLEAFLAQARQFSLRQPRAKLSDFLHYLDLVLKYRIQLPVNRTLSELIGLYVSTVHGAKGMEFETVIMPDISDIYWNNRKNRSVINLPGSVVALKDWQDHTEEDERRLFYVGVTRAKNRLVFTYPKVNDEGKENLPAQFSVEMKDELYKTKVSLKAETIISSLERQFQPIDKEILSGSELEAIRKKISSNPFSYTDLSTYQLCPKQYLLSRVFRLPNEPSIPLVYGNAVHRALELFFREYRSKKRLPSQKLLLAFFEQALSEQPSISNTTQIQTKGRQVLGSYYDKLSPSWRFPEGVEYNFRAHHVMLNDDIWLTGKFDRMEAIDKKSRSVRIIDYKTTSRVPSRNQILGETKNGDGRYYRQWVFYALLAQLDRLFPYRASEFTLSFIDDQEKFKEENFAIDRASIDKLAAEIVDTYKEIIQTKHFEHTRDTFDQGCEICAAFPSL